MYKPVNSRSNLPLKNASPVLQLLDYKEVFSSALDFCQACAASPDFDVSDVHACIKRMQIQNFYGCVRRLAGGTTHHSLQRMFEPNSFHFDEFGKLNHSKKWRGYARGLHMPRQSTIAKVEAICGVKLRHEVNQMLWFSLDVTVPLKGEKTMAMLKSLSVETRKKAFKIFTKIQRRPVPNDSEIYTWCQDCLRNEPGLTTLAVFTLLLREAKKFDCVDAMSTISHSIFQLLLLLGEELQQRGIGYLLYPFFVEHILPIYWGEMLDETAVSMARMSMLVNLFAFVDPNGMRSGSMYLEDRAENMCRWLNFYGHYVPCGLFEPMVRSCPNGYSEDFVTAMKRGTNVYWSMLVPILKSRRPPMIYNPIYLDWNFDLDFSVLTGHRCETLLAVVDQMLVRLND
ncbi:hypothetical protein [Rhodoferax ferrireducens]|uniref:hypothetical protein n=1 Tax=Rhodoferax ferrireducens TaxID=192843 RepID=UPI0013008F71|nr:hypothetical protein [Rhodoferax ferrireducens]